MPETIIFTDRLSIMPTTASTGPSRSASKAAWVEHAVASGFDPAVAEDMTRDELVAEFSSES